MHAYHPGAKTSVTSSPRNPLVRVPLIRKIFLTNPLLSLIICHWIGPPQ
jgi:hypothetical protein